MALGSDFKHAQRLGMIPPTTDTAPEVRDEPVEKWRPKGPRRVRTMRGAKIFGQPIGTIITRDMVERARRTGKLKAAGEAAYGHYAPAKAPAPARAARAAAKPARAGARAASKVSAPKAPVKAPSRPKGGRGISDAEFKATLQRASYKDVRAMIADLQNDDHIDDKTFDKRLDMLLMRGRVLRPNKDHGTPPAKREAKAPPKPAAKPAPKAPEAPARPQSAMDDPAIKAKVQEFDDALEGVQNEAELNLVERYLGKEKLPVREAARLRVAIKTKRATLTKPKEQPKAEAKKPEPQKALPQRKPDPKPSGESADAGFMRLRSAITAFERDGAGATPERKRVEADRLRNEVMTHPSLTPQMRNLLVEQIAEAENGGKVRRSARYDTLAGDIRDVSTRMEGRDLFKDINEERGWGISPDEHKSLIQQLAAHMEDIGFDAAALADPTIDFNDPSVGKDWDTLPSKVKKPVGTVPPKWRALLHERRKVLARVAEAIRSKEMKDPDNTPAGKEVASGTPLDRVRDPRGLIAYVDAHPERFKKSFIPTDGGGGGQGGAFTVTDKQTGKEFFFKETMNGQPNAGGLSVEMHGEAVNEVMSGKIGSRAFGQWFPDTDFASDLVDGVQPVIRMDHLKEFALRGGQKDFKSVKFNAEDRWDMPFDYDPGAPIAKKAKKVRDPKNPLTLHIFDFLTNQTDRHMGNYAQIEHQDGTVTLVAVDNGAAFSGFDSFINQKTLNIPQHFIDAPESIGYAEWANTYTQHENFARPRFMAAETLKAYEDHGLDFRQMKKDADEVIKTFREMSIDEIVADMRRRFPNMPDYEQAHLDNAALIFKSRLQNITGRDVANLIANQSYKPEGEF